MRIPKNTSGPHVRIGFANYVTARLVRSGDDELAQPLKTVTVDYKQKARAAEDLNEEVSAVIGARDAVDDAINEAIQEGRLKLASRSVDAANSEPLSSIFREGIEYFTAASLADVPQRLGELKLRLEAHLPENDEVRTSLVPRLVEGRTAFEAASAAVAEARAKARIAVTSRESAEDEWERAVERVYGALVTKYGRRKAERFFPRSRRRSSAVAANDA